MASDFGLNQFLPLFISGKNDGSVKGVGYFSCASKHGKFVRPDKVMLDKRGRSIRPTSATTPTSNNRNNYMTTSQQQQQQIMSTSMNGSAIKRSTSRGKFLK